MTNYLTKSLTKTKISKINESTNLFKSYRSTHDNHHSASNNYLSKDSSIQILSDKKIQFPISDPIINYNEAVPNLSKRGVVFKNPSNDTSFQINNLKLLRPSTSE